MKTLGLYQKMHVWTSVHSSKHFILLEHLELKLFICLEEKVIQCEGWGGGGGGDGVGVEEIEYQKYKKEKVLGAELVYVVPLSFFDFLLGDEISLGFAVTRLLPWTQRMQRYSMCLEYNVFYVSELYCTPPLFYFYLCQFFFFLCFSGGGGLCMVHVSYFFFNLL